jgi:hypothetical protein
VTGFLREGEWLWALASLAPVMMGVVAASVPLLWLRHRARVPDPGLLLTPETVHLPGPGLPVLAWDQLTGTRASWVSRPAQGSRSSVSNLLSLALTPEAEAEHVLNPYVAHTGAFHLSVDTLASDPHAVRALLDHYLANPQDRHELGTDAALRRFEELASGRPES